MASDQQLAALYGQLRAAFLSRHFALGRFFRTNYFTERNRLDTSLTSTELLNLSAADQQLHRWRRTRETDNPMLMGSMLLSCLAVEDALGHPHAPRIIHAAVATLKSLYKFSGNHFDGYPIRWDPTSSDRWRPQDGAPAISDEFLVDENGKYVFCSSSSDPRHSPRRGHATLARLMGETEAARYTQANGDLGAWRDDYFSRYRQWELSMDELVGLVASYFILGRLATSPGTRMEVTRQANNLGDYLAEHGWLLVRPVGGLNGRGATGILPALEFPLGRALMRVTATSYPSRTSFEGAMKQAGYWNCLSDALALWTAVGVVAPVIAPMLTGVIAALGLFPFVPEAASLAGIALPAAGIPATLLAAAVPVASVPMARTYAVYQARDCFDVKNDDAASEVAAALFLRENISPSLAFQGWMFGSGFTGGKGHSWAAGFPPFLALTALDDADTTVRDAYLGWLAERRKHPELEPTDRSIALGCFASAVAVLLGAGPTEEAQLKALLDQRHAALAKTQADSMPPGPPFNSDLAVVDEAPVHEVMHPAMDYLVGLALAWLHAKRRADAGAPVTTAGFPTVPSNIAFWPVPAVPGAVITDAGPGGKTTLPIAAIQGTPNPTVLSYGAELFATDNAPGKSDIPQPVLPPAPTMMVIDRTIPVNKSSGDVDSGIVLNDGDEFEIAATGTISAGDALHGANGPNGWENDITWDATFPLFGALDPVNAHPNCLVGRLGGYFFIGEHRPRQRFLYHQSCPLWLGINSNAPGSGSGWFEVRVQVWSTRDSSLRDVLSKARVTPTRASALAQGLRLQWPPPPTLSLRNMMLLATSRS